MLQCSLPRGGRWACLGLGALAALALVAGCDPSSRQARCSPRGGHGGLGNGSHIEPAPPLAGTYVNNYIRAQAHKAEADDFVIYNYEWYQGGDVLGPIGARHLESIIRWLPTAPFPVLIEPCDGEPALNERRRVLVVARLVAAGVPAAAAEQRVVLGFSDTGGGLFPDEIEPIYQRMVTPSQNSQGFPGSLGGGVPGFGTPPFAPQLPIGGFGGFGIANYGGIR